MQHLPIEIPPAATELGRILYNSQCTTQELADLRAEVRRLRNALERVKQNTLSSTIRDICDEQLRVNERAVEA